MSRAKYGTQATLRDEVVLGQIASLGCVYQPDVGRLFQLFDDRRRTDSTIRESVARWRRAGWITGRKVLRHRPRIIAVTEEGCHLIGAPVERAIQQDRQIADAAEDTITAWEEVR